MSELVLLRHGETEWTRTGQHTGRTDLDLTPFGEDQARVAARVLAGRRITLVLVSPLLRARRTAELAGLTGPTVEPDLQEWDYGTYEGLTTAEIQGERPDWDLFRDGAPGGENAVEVGERVDRVLSRIDAIMKDRDGGDAVVVAHGHVLRVLVARRLGLPAALGSCFRMDTASVGSIGLEHGRPVLTGWNQHDPMHTPVGAAGQACVPPAREHGQTKAGAR